jgi:CheY-like chemotaxis protein
VGAEQITERRKASTPDWRERPIVVCDPSNFTRRMTVDLLRYAGASRIVSTEHGSSAWYALKQSRNPILIADGRHGEMSTLVRRLRRAPGARKQAPAILISGGMQQADVSRARDIGVNAIAARPLAPQTLFDRLNEVSMRPRRFIDTPRFSGPDRRAGRPAQGEHKRQADIDAGLVTPLDAARAEARSVIFERLRMNDPLAARVGRSLERFLAHQTAMTDHAAEIIALHRATLGKLLDVGEGTQDTRLEIVAGLERLVTRRAA